MTGMTDITKYLPYGEYIPWDRLVGKKTSQASDDVKTALQNGEFYGPGGSREEFITWMEGQEPKWEKREEAHCTQEEFDGVHAFWERENKLLKESDYHINSSYLEAYREYRVGVYEKIYAPNRLYRNKMVEYAEKNDTQQLDEIKQWHEITNNLINTGQIKQSPEGIEMVGLGFEMLNKSVHDKVIQHNFVKDIEYSEKSYDDHAGSRINLEVRKDALDTFIKDGKTFGEGIDLGGEKKHLKKMLEWIAEKFKVNNKTKQLYILQMINPDLFGRHWMKNTTGNYRQYLILLRNVYSRNVDEYDDPDNLCGLFLVRKR